MDSFRDHYFQALGTRNPDELKEACKLAYEIRKFEIELYWKRATYFWAFQLIAFTALGFVLKGGQCKSLPLLLIAESIGVITALAGYLTARGSKFWQENWEAHVDLLEHEMGVRLTQVILCREPPQFSVSRINRFLLLLLTFAWTIALFLGAVALILTGPSPAPEVPKWLWPFSAGITIPILIGVVCRIMYRRNRTHFTGRTYSFGETSWTEYGFRRTNAVPFILWRDPLSERRARIPESSPEGQREPDGRASP